jgi:hypothetical protein
MRFIISFVFCLFLLSCFNKKNTPNVSDIKINIQTQRFEKDFFAIDTNNIMPALDKLQAAYPEFTKTYLISILGVDPRWTGDTTSNYIKQYLQYSKSIYDTAQLYYSNFAAYEKQIKKSFQFVKYYFPTYKLPTNIITFIGPADGTGDGLGNDFYAVGLQAHLGKDFPLYKSDMVRNVYPDYVSANFTPDFIVVNCMKNIVADMYPETNDDKRLIIQMIEKGKRLYLLEKLLPDVSENKLIGYTASQMEDCNNHQKEIWNLFTQNNYLQIADNNLIKNYVSEGPKTQELGEDAPGNIGSYAGWQIVRKFITKNDKLTLDSLMKTNTELIYKEAKYKP